MKALGHKRSPPTPKLILSSSVALDFVMARAMPSPDPLVDQRPLMSPLGGAMRPPMPSVLPVGNLCRLP